MLCGGVVELCIISLGMKFLLVGGGVLLLFLVCCSLVIRCSVVWWVILWVDWCVVVNVG